MAPKPAVAYRHKKSSALTLVKWATAACAIAAASAGFLHPLQPLLAEVVQQYDDTTRTSGERPLFLDPRLLLHLIPPEHSFHIDVVAAHVALWALVFILLHKIVIRSCVASGEDYNKPLDAETASPRWSFWVCALRSFLFCAGWWGVLLVTALPARPMTALLGGPSTSSTLSTAAWLRAAGNHWAREKSLAVADYSSLCTAGGPSALPRWNWFENVCDYGAPPPVRAEYNNWIEDGEVEDVASSSPSSRQKQAGAPGATFSVSDWFSRKFRFHQESLLAASSSTSLTTAESYVELKSPAVQSGDALSFEMRWVFLTFCSFMGMMVSDIWTYYGIPALNTSSTLIAHHIVSGGSVFAAVFFNTRGLFALANLLLVAEVGTCLYSVAALYPEKKALVALYKYGMTLSNIGLVATWLWFLYCNGPRPPVFDAIFFSVCVGALAQGRQDFMYACLNRWSSSGDEVEEQEEEGVDRDDGTADVEEDEQGAVELEDEIEKNYNEVEESGGPAVRKTKKRCRAADDLLHRGDVDVEEEAEADDKAQQQNEVNLNHTPDGHGTAAQKKQK
mmetsp:Transcript_1962/g.4542  ORF Transcript_1962/g.4542 Transcript_1962/m.4542 type:complete len:562 (-) Transcript_1962:177-1862(-)|eukprot:CAMPEP_0178988744 /NCGR_PEP_ID=MMETSP0795-20121207/3972_1 /TAXON_ID=88552 /ORGANISM="Amoebophrya sp., Strain Ameob2" /LENGTH=561 /DNA_ID=CAMNT_0020680035 /DNA_START=282 /DNA_END=1967 /DNA_ORIENTATION=-